jgi:hypothetical protein
MTSRCPPQQPIATTSVRSSPRRTNGPASTGSRGSDPASSRREPFAELAEVGRHHLPGRASLRGAGEAGGSFGWPPPPNPVRVVARSRRPGGSHSWTLAFRGGGVTASMAPEGPLGPASPSGRRTTSVHDGRERGAGGGCDRTGPSLNRRRPHRTPRPQRPASHRPASRCRGRDPAPAFTGRPWTQLDLATPAVSSEEVCLDPSSVCTHTFPPPAETTAIAGHGRENSAGRSPRPVVCHLRDLDRGSRARAGVGSISFDVAGQEKPVPAGLPGRRSRRC